MKCPATVRVAIATLALSVISACATAPQAPTRSAKALLPGDGPARVQFRSSTTDVLLLDADATRVAARIRARLPAAAQREGLARYRVEVALTEYDKGNTYVRSMVSGLSELHAEAALTVFAEPEGRVIGRSTLSATSAPIGVDGSSSRIADIEDALAKAVAEALL